MDIIALATACLGIIDKFLENQNIKAQRKYQDMWFKNEQQIKDERSKWPNSDDPKLERLYSNRQDILKAAEQEFEKAMVKK